MNASISTYLKHLTAHRNDPCIFKLKIRSKVVVALRLACLRRRVSVGLVDLNESTYPQFVCAIRFHFCPSSARIVFAIVQPKNT